MTVLAIAKHELLDAFRRTGIAQGDVVYVASSMAALGLMDDPIEDTLWALREAVGADGTLVMPAFNFGFCEGETFDPECTPSACGRLSEAFRLQPGVRRTIAPPYHSVTALGPRAAEFPRLQSITSFGPDSAFQYLHDIGAKHLLIGCGYHDGVAHFHWLEEMCEVPYRFWKKIEGHVVEGGEVRRQAFFMYARRLDVDVKLNADPLGGEFEHAGHVRTATVGLCRIRAFDLQEFARFVGRRMKEDPLVLLDPSCRDSFGRKESPVTGVDHIGIVSRHASRIEDVLEAVACDLTHEGTVADLGVRCRYFSGLNVRIELVDPVAEPSCVDGHLRRNPSSPLHHIAFQVSDMDAAVVYFRAKGYAPLDGRRHLGPKPGQEVLFLSPALTGGLLVELVCDGEDRRSNPEGMES